MATIVIVEDKGEGRRGAARLLADRGHRVAAAHCLSRAVALIGGGDPDLVLIDTALPELDGFELIHWMRSRGDWSGRTPVVVFTAGPPSPEARALAERCGAVHLVDRDCDDDAVLRTVAEAIATVAPARACPGRLEFTMDYLRVLTSSLTQKVWTVIPALADVLAGPRQTFCEESRGA